MGTGNVGVPLFMLPKYDCRNCIMLESENKTLRARIEVLEKVVEWACVRLGIVNDPAYSGYTHDLCNEVIAELRRRAKEG